MKQEDSPAEKARRFENLVRQSERVRLATGRRFGRPDDPPDTLQLTW